jgi:signal peptidase II
MLPLGLAVAAVIALLDQASKLWVLRYFSETGCANHLVPVTSFFDFVLTCNRGVSFGFFNQPGAPALGFWIFSVLATVIVLALVVWLFRVRSVFLAVAIGLIIGGAIGNVVDRLRLGGVVDFLYFHVGAWYWPAFNFADSAICLGVAAMLLDGLLLRRDAPQAKGREDLSR